MAHDASPKRLFRRETRGLVPYNAGLSEDQVRRRYGVDRVVKLASNENPLGASPAVRAALSGALDRVSVYPDATCATLREALAGRLEVAPGRIVIGNGSEDLISVLCRSFLDAGDRVIVSSPTFAIYRDYAEIMGARIVDVPRRGDLHLDVPAVSDALGAGAKLLFLCNPNNPTGTPIPRDDYLAICEAASPDTVIVSDEAYYEYAHSPDYPDGLHELPATGRPFVVLRTFAKAYGLAGLRVGYGVVSHEDIAGCMNLVRTPFNVNVLAQRAAVAALGDPEHVQRSVDACARERARVAAALAEQGFPAAPSLANFLFFDTGRPSSELAGALLRAGVVIKPWKDPGYETWCRVTIGSIEDNDAFLAALPLAAAV